MVEGGRVVFEAGHAGHDPRAPHAIHGAAAAFWGVAAAAAVEEGLLRLDEPVEATLPGFASGRHADEVRVQHLLHFTSGLESGEARAGDEAAWQMVSRPGERFQYGPSHLRVFAALLSAKLAEAGRDEDAAGYLERRVLAPQGVSVRFDRDAEGRVDAGAGAALTARDWARFGALLAGAPGEGGRRVLEPAALAPCFEGSDANPSYGLGVWLNVAEFRAGTTRDALVARRALFPGGPEDLRVALGAGNQRLYVIPSLDLVVVRFAERDRRFRDAELLERLVTAVTAATSPSD